jgi:hypothetical protein
VLAGGRAILPTVEGTAVVGIIVAGVVGPAIAVYASRLADRRRFEHERKLKASDDLIERIDEVGAALGELGAACATTRQVFLALAASEPDKLWPPIRDAEDAYQRARALTARLGMRPHADAELVKKAEAAAGSHQESTKAVRINLIRSQAARAAVGSVVMAEYPVERVMEHIETGYTLTREYEVQARVAIGQLLA